MTVNRHESVERAARYARHITDLAAAFHVRLIVRADMPPHFAVALSRVNEKAVLIAPVIDETTYAVALHELGHHLHPTGTLFTMWSKRAQQTGAVETMSDARIQLLEERSAWEWARYHALEWTPPMTMVESCSLSSYERIARRLGVRV